MCTISGSAARLAASLAASMTCSPALATKGPTSRSFMPETTPGLLSTQLAMPSASMSSRLRTSAGFLVLCAKVPTLR